MWLVIRWTALVIPTLVLLLVMEWAAGVYLKARYEGFDLAVQGGGEMPPSSYQLWAHPSNYWNWLKLNRYNNLGFRSLEDVSIEKPEGVIRIVIMGGSGALGSGANPTYPWINMSGQGQYSPAETIADQLEGLFNRKYPNRRHEVINAATNWAQLHQQIVHYLRKIRYLDPDIVISIDGQNDALPIDDHYLSTWDKSELEKVAYLKSNLRTKLQPVIKRSNLMYLVAGLAFAEKRQGKIPVEEDLVESYVSMSPPENIDAIIEDYALSHSDLIDRGVNFYIDHLWFFYDVLKRDDVAALFVQQPQLIMDKTKPFTQIEIAMKNYMHTRDLRYEFNFFRSLESMASNLSRNKGLPYISFLNIFDNEHEEIYTDYTHLTPLGNGLLAVRLMHEIEGRYPNLFASTD